jgi:hypothetical protein
MTTRRLTTMARVSATTHTCQDTVTMWRASRQVRKCLTTCHNLIKTWHGTRWMILIMTQTQTQTLRHLPISWMCEARRRRGLLFLNCFFGPVPVTVHCIPHLYTTNHLLLLQYANTYCSSANPFRNTVLSTVVLVTSLAGNGLRSDPTHTIFVVIIRRCRCRVQLN